jgi:hypothetical protein
MMIVVLTTQGASFFHVRASLPALGGDSQIFEAIATHGRCGQKIFLRAADFKLFSFSIPMRVDRGIDREETAVAAVS